MLDTLAFLPGMTEHLGYYVYALRDPRPGRGIFYVGKGVGDRVYHHARAASAVSDDEPGQDLKLDTIREIHREGREVGVEILRHRLTEPEAYDVEAGVIDALILADVPLTNKVIGVHSRAQSVL